MADKVEETTAAETQPVNEQKVPSTPKKSNVVSDASVLPESQDQKEILKQVEFYFSDENFPKDKFLYTTSQKNHGWVPISTICMFSRMKRFKPVTAVVEALKQSEELLEVSEDGELVRRKKPLVEPKPEERVDTLSRCVYAKGFGEETASTQFDIENLFETYGLVKQVRLRRTQDKTFKSSVFVEFAKLEDAQKFLAADPKPKYNDVELLTMSKKAYMDMKSLEHGFTSKANGTRLKQFNAFKESNHQKRKNNFNPRDNNKRRRDNRPDRKEKEQKTQEEQKPVESEPAKSEGAETSVHN
jgi:lupus La protein